MNDTVINSDRPSKKRTGERQRICYLSAPSHINLKTLREILAARGIKSVIPSELPSTATTILGEITKAISEADIFIAVLDSEQGNVHVYFELGIAVASGVRVLLLAPPEVLLPLDVAEVPSFRTNAENREAINFALDQVLAAVPSARYKPHPPIPADQLTKPIGGLADKLLDAIESLGDRLLEEDIIDIIMQALQASSISIVAQAPISYASQDTIDHRSHNRVDIAIWSDEFDPWIGNPFLIEVKKSLTSQKQRVEVANYLLKCIQQYNTRSALILYIKGPPKTVPDFQSTFPPNIFFLEVRELLRELRTKSFTKIIYDLRNRRIHGGA